LKDEHFGRGNVYFSEFIGLFRKMERRLKNNFLASLVLVCVGLCLGAASLEAATFTASLDRDTIAMGETATLSLTFEGSQPKGAPQIMNIPGLQIAYVGPSSQFSFVNGQTSSTVTYHFTIVSRRPGEYTIPAMTAQVDGQSLTSQPLKLTVTQPNAPPAAGANSSSPVAFMQLALAKTNVYVGEVTTANIKIYLRDDVQAHGQPQFAGLPASGFAVGKGVYQEAYREPIGNRVYTVLPASVPITATKTGPASVGPITGSVVVELPSSNPQRDPFFERFGIRSPMFNSGEQRQIPLATDEVTVNSLPLPTENAPPSFNGAVGNYTLTVNAGPTNVAVGDPITVHVQISGRGALDALALPDQAGWRDFKTYPPTQSVKTTDRLGMEGTKTFEQIVTPQSPDVHELPAFSFSYFDPETEAYRTLAGVPLPLVVHSGGTTPAPVIAAAKTAHPQTTPQQQDILPIKEQTGTLMQTAVPLLTRPVFLAAQTLPVLAWLAAWVWRKRTDNLANNPRLRRQRQVAQLVRDGLVELRRLAAENNSDEFFATLFRLLQEQLGERLDCPGSSITEAVIDERLALLGVPDATLAGLRELFHLNNQARYAPLRTSGELAAVIPQFENVVHELQNVKA
jgi:hypothetical protein